MCFKNEIKLENIEPTGEDSSIKQRKSMKEHTYKSSNTTGSATNTTNEGHINNGATINIE